MFITLFPFHLSDWSFTKALVFQGFVPPVMECCSVVRCSAADTHLKLLDRVVSGTHFLTGFVFECDIALRRPMAVLCMLYKIRCNPMRTLYGDLPGPYVPVRVIRSALVAHRYTYAQPGCSTLHYSRTFILLSVSLLNDRADPVFDGVGLAGLKIRANRFLSAFVGRSHFVYYFSLSLLSVYIGWYRGAGVFGLIGCRSLSLILALLASFNNNNSNNPNKNKYLY